MEKPTGPATQPIARIDPEAGALENEILRRYGNAAEEIEKGLCCPIDYETTYLRVIPQEILEKDYGCGDPSKYVHESETVLDLGSGGGKICYILSQKVGASGHVIGVDFNDRMITLARKYQDQIADAIGYTNVDFRKGKIQDLALDLDKLNAWLNSHPVLTVEDLHQFDAECARLRREEPLVADNCIDVVVSNCVLNLVRPEDKELLFSEIHRVLRPGGRAVISDIVCDEDPTPAILADPELWSGCISGAFRKDVFLEKFERAGFHGVTILERQIKPWQTINGIEFRSLTLEATKTSKDIDLDIKQAVVYKGPWKEVQDEHGMVLRRGCRTAVGSAGFARMTDPHGPYHHHVIPIEPLEPVDPKKANRFDSSSPRIRSPREAKGKAYRLTVTSNDDTCCSSGGCGC